MGLFSGIKSAYKKSEASLAIQDILKNHVKLGMVDREIETLASTLIEAVWRKYPAAFDGSFGQRPQRISVVAAALANGVGSLSPHTKIWNAVLASLDYTLSEIEANGDLYPLNGIDKRLLDTASKAYRLAKDSHRNEQVGEWYPTFESWYQVFCRGACEVNPQLRGSEQKGSFIDFMDHAPLKDAWRDKVEPEQLGREFGEQFDITTFGR